MCGFDHKGSGVFVSGCGLRTWFDTHILRRGTGSSYAYLYEYFALDGRYDVIAAVSFLEIALRMNEEVPGPSVPLGYTEHLTMHPLDFEEFLWAKGIGDDTIAMLRSCIYDRVSVPEDMHILIDSFFREFMVIGGMSEAVREYMDTV